MNELFRSSRSNDSVLEYQEQIPPKALHRAGINASPKVLLVGGVKQDPTR